MDDTNDRLQVPKLERILQLRVGVAKPEALGETWRGTRRIVPILDGDAWGPLFTATVLPGGADVQILRPDGVTDLVARYTLRLPNGRSVYIENSGVRHAAPEVMQRLNRGEAVNPNEVYFRSSVRFETDDPSLTWLERRSFVGVGGRFPEHVRIDIYRVD
jgi:Protein of unknown function (DUF3237)